MQKCDTQRKWASIDVIRRSRSPAFDFLFEAVAFLVVNYFIAFASSLAVRL